MTVALAYNDQTGEVRTRIDRNDPQYKSAEWHVDVDVSGVGTIDGSQFIPRVAPQYRKLSGDSTAVLEMESAEKSVVDDAMRAAERLRVRAAAVGYLQRRGNVTGCIVRALLANPLATTAQELVDAINRGDGDAS